MERGQVINGCTSKDMTSIYYIYIKRVEIFESGLINVLNNSQ